MLSILKNSECPECGGALGKRATKCRCGWQQIMAPTAPGHRSIDPQHACCEWISSGERCLNPGAHADGDKGLGPWYCWPHHECHDIMSGAEIVARSREKFSAGHMSVEARRAASEAPVLAAAKAFCAEQGLITVAQMQASIKDKLSGFHAKKPSTDWAQKILMRAATGEAFAPVAIQYATATVRQRGQPLPHEREPGEDDDQPTEAP